MNNPRIIAIANQKGGVGKTTTAINLSTALAAIGKKTLLIDLDPQGNASTGVGFSENSSRVGNIYDVLVKLDMPKTCVKQTLIPNLDLIPSVIDLAAAEIELYDIVEKEFQLKRRLDSIKADYEYIIIDCPPSLGMLTINALAFAQSIIIPLQSEFFALEGLIHLINTIKLVKKAINPDLVVEGIVLTMVDKRNKLTFQVEQDVRQTFGDLVYETVIPRNIKLSEAPSHGKPAIIYDSSCSGSHAYMMLAKEIIRDHEFVSNDNMEKENDSRETSFG